MSNSTDIIFSGVMGLMSGANFGAGLNALVMHYSKIDSLRDAVYAHADKITPETIEQVNSLVSQISGRDYYRALFNLGVAGLAGAMSYYIATTSKRE